MHSKIIVYTGPMFSGKSGGIIRAATSQKEGQFIAFKPSIDDRTKNIYSRNGVYLEAINIDNLKEIDHYITNNIKTIIIDEVQFFPTAIVKKIQQWKNDGIYVFVSGLDKDFAMNKFITTQKVIDIADRVTYFRGRCHMCGKPSEYTKKWVKGIAAHKNSPKIEVENFCKSDVVYETSCLKCHKKTKPIHWKEEK